MADWPRWPQRGALSAADTATAGQGTRGPGRGKDGGQATGWPWLVTAAFVEQGGISNFDRFLKLSLAVYACTTYNSLYEPLYSMGL